MIEDCLTIKKIRYYNEKELEALLDERRTSFTKHDYKEEYYFTKDKDSIHIHHIRRFIEEMPTAYRLALVNLQMLRHASQFMRFEGIPALYPDSHLGYFKCVNCSVHFVPETGDISITSHFKIKVDQDAWSKFEDILWSVQNGGMRIITDPIRELPLYRKKFHQLYNVLPPLITLKKNVR